MKRTQIILVCLALGLLGTYLLLNQNTEDDSIAVGFVGPLTGDASVIGIPNKAAVEYAVNEINMSGGVNGKTINLIVEDGKCDGKEATTVGKKLIEVDKVKYIIGGICSSETLAIASLAEQAKVILLSPGSSNPDITDSGDYVFRNYPSDAYQGVFAARYIAETLRMNSISVIAAKNDYAQGVKKEFEKEFKRLGGTIASSDDVDQNETSFQTVLTNIKNKQPDVIYAATSVASQAVQLMTQARQIGIASLFFGVESWDEKTLFEHQNVTEGAMFAAIKTPEAPESLKQGIKSVCSTCDIMPAVLQSYDAVHILAQAIGKENDYVKDVKSTLYQTSYNGVSGKIEFDQNGDLKEASYVAKKVVNGTTTVIEAP